MPRYLRLAAVLRRRIAEGRWPQGTRIATLSALMEEFGVARVTVRQAIALLTDEGLLRARQGSGTYVTKAPSADRWLRLSADWEGLIAPIRGNVPRRLPARDAAALPEIRPGEGRAAPAYVYLRSLQRRGREPFGLASVHLAEQVHRKAARTYETRVALAELLEREGPQIAAARMSFSVGAADVEAARLLRLPLDAPTVQARCVVRSRSGEVLYVGEFVYPADVVQFDVELCGPVRSR